jgi:hypothetical protein
VPLVVSDISVLLSIGSSGRQWLSEMAPHFYKFRGGDKELVDKERAHGGEPRLERKEEREGEGNARKVPRL